MSLTVYHELTIESIFRTNNLMAKLCSAIKCQASFEIRCLGQIRPFRNINQLTMRQMKAALAVYLREPHL